LRVVREVRCVFSQCLKVSNLWDSLIIVGNSFQMVGAEKLKEILLKLVCGKECTKDSDWLNEDSATVGILCRRFLQL